MSSNLNNMIILLEPRIMNFIIVFFITTGSFLNKNT